MREIPGFTWKGKNLQGYEEWIHEQTKIVFVLLPGGEFAMGSPDGEAGRSRDEGPVHCVTLDPFLIAKHEVTQAQWRAVTDESPSCFKHAGDDAPVEQVSWVDCREMFLAKTGLRFPAEAQWEYACRAGTRTSFSCGDRITGEDVNCDGTCAYNGAPASFYRKSTVPVGTLPANAFGIHQMHGNVWEWCEDVYNSEFYSTPQATERNPLCTSGCVAPAVGNRPAIEFRDRVLRGGSWFEFAWFCRSATRSHYGAHSTRDAIGLRPAFWPLPQ